MKPALKRRGIASALVHRAEGFVRAEGGRELYADAPVTNEVGRRCYEASGYRQAYVMPAYYDEGLDGVTYLELFATSESLRRCALLGPLLQVRPRATATNPAVPVAYRRRTVKESSPIRMTRRFGLGIVPHA